MAVAIEIIEIDDDSEDNDNDNVEIEDDKVEIVEPPPRKKLKMNSPKKNGVNPILARFPKSDEVKSSSTPNEKIGLMDIQECLDRPETPSSDQSTPVLSSVSSKSVTNNEQKSMLEDYFQKKEVDSPQISKSSNSPKKLSHSNLSSSNNLDSNEKKEPTVSTSKKALGNLSTSSSSSKSKPNKQDHISQPDNGTPKQTINTISSEHLLSQSPDISLISQALSSEKEKKSNMSSESLHSMKEQSSSSQKPKLSPKSVNQFNTNAMDASQSSISSLDDENVADCINGMKLKECWKIDSKSKFYENLHEIFSDLVPVVQLIIRENMNLNDLMRDSLEGYQVDDFIMEFAKSYRSLVDFLIADKNFIKFLRDYAEEFCDFSTILKLIYITDGLGEAIILYAPKFPSALHIFEPALDALHDMAMLCRCALVHEHLMRQNCIFDLTDNKLDFALGYSLGLTMLQAIVRNIFEDAEMVYSLKGKQNTVENSSDSLENIPESVTRLRSRMSSDSSSSKISSMTYSRLFQHFPYQPKNERVCSMCRSTNSNATNNLKLCHGCFGFFHIRGSCFQKWKIGNQNNMVQNTPWQCPVCVASMKLVDACRLNQKEKVYELLVQQCASPMYRQRDLKRTELENTTALHIAIKQNNYELSSMLLTGAFYLLKSGRELQTSSMQLPDRCWGRDGCQKGCEKYYRCWEQQHRYCNMNAFNRGKIKSTSLSEPPPIESLLLLAARGGGDIQAVEEIPIFRSKALALLSGNEDHDQSDVFPPYDVSNGIEKIPVPWVNETGDGEKLIADFTYIDRAVESDDVGIPWFRFQNKTGSSNRIIKTWNNVKIDSSNPTAGFKKITLKANGRCTKERQGRALKIEQARGSGTVQFECNYLCPCANNKKYVVEAGRLDVMQCGNRYLSNGINHCLEIFRTELRGWGVRTCRGQTIEKDDIVCMYGGIYRTEDDMKELEMYYKEIGKESYILNLAKLSGKNERMQYVIDGTLFRSVSGFINHECAGGKGCNLRQFHVLANHLDSQLPLVGFMAKEKIPPLTELCFDYGDKLLSICPKCDEEHCLCQYCMDEKCRYSSREKI